MTCDNKECREASNVPPFGETVDLVIKNNSQPYYALCDENRQVFYGIIPDNLK